MTTARCSEALACPRAAVAASFAFVVVVAAVMSCACGAPTFNGTITATALSLGPPPLCGLHADAPPLALATFDIGAADTAPNDPRSYVAAFHLVTTVSDAKDQIQVTTASIQIAADDGSFTEAPTTTSAGGAADAPNPPGLAALYIVSAASRELLLDEPAVHAALVDPSARFRVNVSVIFSGTLRGPAPNTAGLLDLHRFTPPDEPPPASASIESNVAVVPIDLCAGCPIPTCADGEDQIAQGCLAGNDRPSTCGPRP